MDRGGQNIASIRVVRLRVGQTEEEEEGAKESEASREGSIRSWLWALAPRPRPPPGHKSRASNNR